MKNVFPLGLLALAACNSPTAHQPGAAAGPAPAATPAPPDSVQRAVASYVRAHAATFPGYEAVGWGRPLPFTMGREAAIKGVVAMKVFDDALVPRNQALQAYKDAQARHAPAAEVAAAKARYGKRNKYNDSLLVIANSYPNVHDTTRLGTEIAHTYRLRNKAGTLELDSATFVIYRGGKVEQL